MIKGSLFNEIGQNLQKGLDWLRKTDLENLADGKYLIDSERIFANVQSYETKITAPFEAHKKYIDIQILLDGVEELDYINVEGLKVKEAYIPERDIMFFDTPEKVLNRIILETGKFVLLYPHEAHQPQMAYKNIPSKVKKVVVKIPVCHSEPA